METQQNEENAATYTHYITWGDARRFFLTLATGGLAVLNFLLIIQAWKMLGLGELTMRQPYSWGQLVICWAFGGEYVIIACTAVCITATIKGGFRNLKPIDEDGLIFGLIIGLISGLIIWAHLLAHHLAHRWAHRWAHQWAHHWAHLWAHLWAHR